MTDDTHAFRGVRVLRTLRHWAGGLALGFFGIWGLSGILLMALPPQLVTGEQNATIDVPPTLHAQNFVAPGGIVVSAGTVSELQLTEFLGRPVYVASGPEGAAMFDALTGEKLSPVDEETALRVARLDYAGDAPVVHSRLLTAPPTEYPGTGSVWQVQFDDDLKTRLYISPSTGVVVARRNKSWFWYAVLRTLHWRDTGPGDALADGLPGPTSIGPALQGPTMNATTRASDRFNPLAMLTVLLAALYLLSGLLIWRADRSSNHRTG